MRATDAVQGPAGAGATTWVGPATEAFAKPFHAFRARGPGMEFEDFQKVDRATWRKYLFYIDLVVIGVFSVALILLVRHTFHAGQAVQRDELDASTRLLWLVVSDTAFLVAALGWIFYRFFRNQYLVLTRRF